MRVNLEGNAWIGNWARGSLENQNKLQIELKELYQISQVAASMVWKRLEWFVVM